MENIILGATYQDVVTGFIGRATARTSYITGCDRITLTPTIDMTESVMREALSFDITALRKIDDGCSDFFKSKSKNNTKVGGPAVGTMGRMY